MEAILFFTKFESVVTVREKAERVVKELTAEDFQFTSSSAVTG